MIDTETLKRKILDLAIKGKLVPQDSTDEPASELLKRIKIERDRLIDEGKIKGKKEDFSYIFKGEDNCYYEKKSSNQIQNITLPTKWCLISLKFVCSLEKGNFNSGENLKYLDVKTLRSEKEAKIIKSGYIVNPNEKVIIVDGENSGEIFTVSERGYMGSTMRLFVANKYINQEYLDIFLQTLKNTLRKNKKGSAIPHLNPGLFYSFMVPLPPIEEQERIANKVNVILKKLEEIKLINENVTKLKDIIKTRIIHLGVNGKLLKSDDNYYCEKMLSDVAKITMGQSIKSEEMDTVDAHNSLEFHQGKTYFTQKTISNSNIYTKHAKKTAEPNSILFSVRAPVGAINYCDRQIAIGRGLAAITPRKDLSIDYLYYLLFDGSKKLIENSTGTTFDAIKKEQLYNLKVLIPQFQTQERIIAIINKCLDTLLIM